ncbi:MAG: 3-deoxy-D-manno-octulosonic acid transferase [Nitrospirae bacterium]|nr:3-deoxy-D-manno-octulosonic acid transferase [Nitrospirota bacterium]
MLLVYNLISAIALLFYLPFLLMKKGPEDKTAFVKERLGISSYTKTDIWVHSVSVGETLACIPFLKRLKREFPGRKITLSTTTYTGQKIAEEKFPEADRIMYMPWDAGICVKRAAGLLKPRIFITIDTEIWPLLIKTLKRSGTKIFLFNGRISSDSFKGYKRAAFFMRKVFNDTDGLCMQSGIDAERIISIGAEPEKVSVMGNFKSDIRSAGMPIPHWIKEIKGRLFLAGSTHRGEDETIMDSFKKLRHAFPELKLIIAPRHPERFDEVESIIRESGLHYIRRSGIKDAGGAELPEAVLLDTVGELAGIFSASSITFMGGSLLPFGGHNILEPAYWGNPIIFGPHMDNFPVHREFLDASAAFIVKDAQEIIEKASEILNNAELAAAMGKKAKAIVDKNSGAVDKAVEIVRRHLGNS